MSIFSFMGKKNADGSKMIGLVLQLPKISHHFYYKEISIA